MVDVSKFLGDGASIAGEVVLKYMFLHDAKRKLKYNLIATFIELDIYEDIFSPCLSGTLTIVESFNLITGIPILGDEMLEVEFFTPALEDKPIKKLFYVTKVDQREHDGDKKNVYVIHFISKEGVVDVNTKISRSFEGTAPDVVRHIYNRELKFDEELEVDEADNRIKFVSPYWSPFRCINFATARCLFPNSRMSTPNYLFFQTNKKFKLKSLSTLFSQEPISDYYFDKNPARSQLDDGTSTKDILREYQTIKELYFQTSQDLIQNTISGAISHKVFGVDLLRKTFTPRTYQIDRDFDKTKHLENNSLYSPEAVSSDNGLVEMKVVSHQMFDGVQDLSDDILAKRLSLLGQLETFKIDIVVPGRTDIEVGNVINFVMTEFRETDADEQKSGDKSDPYYSGKYLISAIQHRVTQSRHLMTMQIIKDSSKNEFKIGEK